MARTSSTSEPHVTTGGDRQEVLVQLDRLRDGVIRPASGAIKYPFCIPGGFYEQQWDWDGFFIAVHLAGRTPARPEYLKYWALNVLASELPDGDVAACITPDGPRLAHPSLRLKPFLAQGAELAGRLMDDDSWLESRYDDVVRMATRWEARHFNEDFGLFVWDDAMRSGADNNPAVGNDPDTALTRAGCDLNAFCHREYVALSRLAERLGHQADRARFAQFAAELQAAVNLHLWDPDNASYWNLDVRDGTWLRRVSYSNFVPLWAGMVPDDRGRAMIERYLWSEDHLLTPFGLRTLSRQDPEYNNELMIVPYSNWQGPVWPIANYFYFVGLMHYGFREQAGDLVERLTGLYLRDIEFCGSLHENYHAETGRPLAPSAEQSADDEQSIRSSWRRSRLCVRTKHW